MDTLCGISSASLRDPFGYLWVLLSRQEDLRPAEKERRSRDLLVAEAK